MAIQIVTFDNLTGGQRQDLPEKQMPDNCFRQARNMIYDRAGNLSSRGGEATFNATAISGATLDNGVRYMSAATPTYKSVVSGFVTGATKIYVADDGAGTFGELTGGTALAAGLPVQFCEFLGGDNIRALLLTNGTGTMQYSKALATKADCVFTDNNIKAKYITEKNRRVILAGISTNASRIYISAEGFWTTDPGTNCSIPTNNWVDIISHDVITGLVRAQDRIFIGCYNEWWELLGETETVPTVSHVITKCGLVSQKAVAATPYGLVWASKDTIWFWVEGGQLIDIGRYGAETLTGADLSTASACYYPARKFAYISFKASSSSTENDTCIILDCALAEDGVYRVLEGTIGAAEFIVCDKAADTGKIYRLAPNATGTSAGKLFQMDTGTQDSAANFTCTVKTKVFDFGDTEVLKRFRRLRFDMDSASASTPWTVGYALDGASSFTDLGSYTASTAASGNFKKAIVNVPSGVNFKKIQFQFTKTSSAVITLLKFAVDLDARPVRNR